MDKLSASRRKFIRDSSLLGLSTMFGGVAHGFQRLAAQAPSLSPRLLGNFAPVFDEIKVADLQINGTIPPDLHGTYLRNGPNPIFPPTPYHWFDGDGMVHSIHLKNGKASYANRFILTEGLLKERQAGKSLYGGLLAGPPLKNAANISIIHHHGKTLAAWEGGSPYEISLDTLGTEGLYDFKSQWKLPFTAHPKIDPTNGDLVLFGYDLTPPFLSYGVVNAKGHLVHSTTIDIPNPVMMHDFAITKNYSVFMDLPLIFSPRGLKYSPSVGARIGVLPRRAKGSDIRWFKINPCFVYHVLNAHEEGNKVILRASRHSDWPESPATLFEWSLDLTSGSVVETELDSTHSEFPILNRLFFGIKNRFGYAAVDGRSLASGFIKYDLLNKTAKTFDFGPGKSGGETYFVPSKDSVAEDSGHLLSFIYDEKKQMSSFIIVNAQTLNLEASVSLPRRVPFGLHGNWIPG